MLRVEWSGIFKKGLDRRQFNLNFNANNLDAAHQIINDYIENKCRKGWRILSNEVEIKKLSDNPKTQESDDGWGE